VSPSEAIIREIAEKHGLTRAQIGSNSQLRRIAWARQEAMYVLRTQRKLTTTQIGRMLRRDHSTVIHGICAYMRRSELLSERGYYPTETDPLGHWPCLNP
jgi:chromosomal replication initiation ATPase DnaA